MSPRPSARSVTVLSPGLLTTVQDLGRPGYGTWGVPCGGALDAEALRYANRLVGNEDGAAGLEIWAQGPVLRAEAPVSMAVLGGLFGPAPGRCIRLASGEELSLLASGAPGRAVVAFDGGIEVPPVLESRSTSLAAGFGGFDGRRLRKGDVLVLGPSKPPPLRPPPPEGLLGQDGETVQVRIAPGPQAALFGAKAFRLLLSSPFTLLAASNRVGFRLQGPRLWRTVPGEMASEGATAGSIQVTTSGDLIILLAEGPPTGGYPKITSVIGADVGPLIRLRAGQRIRFAGTDWDSAREALRERERRLETWTST